jgi:hypothetical protein
LVFGAKAVNLPGSLFIACTRHRTGLDDSARLDVAVRRVEQGR